MTSAGSSFTTTTRETVCLLIFFAIVILCAEFFSRTLALFIGFTILGHDHITDGALAVCAFLVRVFLGFIKSVAVGTHGLMRLEALLQELVRMKR